MWLSFHAFMRLIFTNIIMQHTSHFKWLHHHPSKAQEPSHCHHGDRRSPTPTLAELSEKSVTRQLHPNFHSVSVMFLEWNCLSGLAPLKPIIVLRPVLGWPAGLTCHSNCLTHSPQTTHVENNESRFTPGWAHSLLAPKAGCCDSTSSLLEVALTNHNTSVRLTVSAHLTCTDTRMHAKPNIFLLLLCEALRWLISDPVSSPSQLNFEVQCKAIHTTPLNHEGLLQIPLIHKTLPAVSIALFIYTAYSSAYTHLCMWPHLPGLLRQVSARVLKGESSHLCAKRKMCSTGEAMLFSPSVNMLINGTVSLSTPHLLKCFTWCLAQVLHAALPFHHFHTNLEWLSLCPFSSAPENTCIQTHTDWIVDDFAATRGKWLETSQC